MPIIRSTRPSLDVDINIFHSLYPVGRERWHTVLLLTDDPGPNPGAVTIYGDMAQLMQDYPVYSATYKAADQFFDQPNVNDIWVMPVPPATSGALVMPLDWAAAINNLIATEGLNFYYVLTTTGQETAVAEFADAADSFECIPIIRNYGGDRAMRTIGTGDAATIWTCRRFGPWGNRNTLTFVVPNVANASLTVSMTANVNGGYDIVVSSATNATMTATTTAAQVVAAVAANPGLSMLVHVAFGGTGTGVISAATRQSFTGGGANPGTVSSFAAMLNVLRSSQVYGIMHTEPDEFFPDVAAAGIFCGMNPGSFTPKNRIVHGVPVPKYTATERSSQRAANINSIFRTPAGHVTLTDGFASDGLFIDITMAIHVMAHWQRMALWDLLAQPPAGYHKVPYDNDGFQMIADALYRTLQRGARPEWNFIVSRAGKPACRLMAPTFEQTDLEDRKNRIYRPRWEATYKGAIHEVVVTGYLTVEFIPPTEQRLGTGIEFTYS